MYTLPVRTTIELDAMRAAGRVVAQTLPAVQAAAVPGVRLRELDELAQTTIREARALPSFLGYRPAWAPTPFNGALCLLPNEVVVHGRPNGRRRRAGAGSAPPWVPPGAVQAVREGLDWDSASRSGAIRASSTRHCCARAWASSGVDSGRCPCRSRIRSSARACAQWRASRNGSFPRVVLM